MNTKKAQLHQPVGRNSVYYVLRKASTCGSSGKIQILLRTALIKLDKKRIEIAVEICIQNQRWPQSKLGKTQGQMANIIQTHNIRKIHLDSQIGKG